MRSGHRFRSRGGATQPAGSCQTGHDISRCLCRRGDSRSSQRRVYRQTPRCLGTAGHAGERPLCLTQRARHRPSGASAAETTRLTRGAFAIVLGAAVCSPLAGVAAQDSLRATCPVESGVFASFSAGDSSPGSRASGPTGGLRLDANSVIDTTWRFDVQERRWSRPYLTASIAAGWTQGTQTSGTTTAPDASAARSWNVCAGVAIGMRDPTLVVRGARGLVHLRADLRSISGVGRSTRDSTSQPRR
jgi:hypothetical protein